jgi:hypothetical protein
MKKSTITTILFVFQLEMINAQCPFQFELDEFLYLCDDAEFPINLGSSMILEPSLEPYTFYWDCFYEPFPGSELSFDEFDFLDDPISQFPNLLGSINGDTLVFTLTATQFNNASCSLSISVVTSTWNIQMEGCDFANIAPGGSATLCSSHLPAMEPAIYQWLPTDYLNDPTSPNPVATPPTDMTYCVMITDAIGCQAHTCMDVNVGVGVNEHSTTKLLAYPNPSSVILTLQSHLAIVKVEISDATGRVILTSQPNVTTSNVNTESLPVGCYFLSVTTENGSIETLKFLKD